MLIGRFSSEPCGSQRQRITWQLFHLRLTVLLGVLLHALCCHGPHGSKYFLVVRKSKSLTCLFAARVSLECSVSTFEGIHETGHQRTLDVSLYGLTLPSLEIGPLNGLEACFTWAVWPNGGGYMHTQASSAFLHGPRDLNSGLQAFIASVLTHWVITPIPHS